MNSEKAIQKILVITSCTGEKAAKHENELTIEDLRQGKAHVVKREAELADHLMPAEELYTGMQHVRLMRGITAVRKNKHFKVDLQILSAGYGLVPGSKEIAPYDATFNGMKMKELAEWAQFLNIPADIRKVVSKSYDLILVLLGDGYLRACQLDDKVVLGGSAIFFTGKASAKRLPSLDNLQSVILGNPDTRKFACGLVGLKGEIVARLLENIDAQRITAADFVEQPSEMLKDLVTAEKPTPNRQQARANPRVDKVIEIPDAWWSKPHRSKLQYFIPEWDDLVDGEFDFKTDTHSGGSGDWSNQVYAHQMYPKPNYDGILVSKIVAEKSKKKKERINEMGVHRFLRVPRQFPVMGDCGAFGYIDEKVPPYSTSEILEYYTRLDFDFGVSIDHLIVTATEADKKERYELTINNADDFLREHRAQGLDWTPVGAVQGWDPKSYVDAAQKYVAMGYDYIALGGLVRTSSPKILEMLHQVREVVPPNVKIHLFGVARLNVIPELRKLGISSVDSASYLRQAWMRSKDSYVLPDGTTYAAIRIPEAGKSFRAKHMREHAELTDEKIIRLEKNALRAIREFAIGGVAVDNCLDALMEYDQFVTSDRQDMSQFYRRTLEEKPWEQCGCAVCKSAGIEVMIFRGNNRNRRRGFHNTYSFYHLFQQAVSGEVIVLDKLGGATVSDSQMGLFSSQESIG